jgi:hypothetical protein
MQILKEFLGFDCVFIRSLLWCRRSLLSTPSIEQPVEINRKFIKSHGKHFCTVKLVKKGNCGHVNSTSTKWMKHKQSFKNRNDFIRSWNYHANKWNFNLKNFDQEQRILFFPVCNLLPHHCLNFDSELPSDDSNISSVEDQLPVGSRSLQVFAWQGLIVRHAKHGARSSQGGAASRDGSARQVGLVSADRLLLPRNVGEGAVVVKVLFWCRSWRNVVMSELDVLGGGHLVVGRAARAARAL